MTTTTRRPTATWMGTSYKVKPIQKASFPIVALVILILFGIIGVITTGLFVNILIAGAPVVVTTAVANDTFADRFWGNIFGGLCLFGPYVICLLAGRQIYRKTAHNKPRQNSNLVIKGLLPYYSEVPILTKDTIRIT